MLVFILILVIGLFGLLVEGNKVWFAEVETVGNHSGMAFTQAVLALKAYHWITS
jgi:hypothetical protein